MPNDAKLGLVVGVGLVIAVAVVFFRKEAPVTGAAPGAVQPSPANTPAPVGLANLARTAAQPVSTPAEPRSHTVQQGETLFGLAQRYYGDGHKYPAIYQVNRNRLESPDQLPPGTVL